MVEPDVGMVVGPCAETDIRGLLKVAEDLRGDVAIDAGRWREVGVAGGDLRSDVRAAGPQLAVGLLDGGVDDVSMKSSRQLCGRARA